MLDRGIEKFFDFGKCDDFIEPALDLIPGHAENCTVKKSVFSPGEFGMKSGADFEQARDAAFNPNAAATRLGDAAQYFQQSRFAGAIAANDADNLSASDIECDVPQSPKFFL
jgi:hypothetical protein